MDEYKCTLRRLTVGDDSYIGALLCQEPANASLAGIDLRAHALIRIAALIALDAAPPSYLSAVQAGLEAGLSYDDVVGTVERERRTCPPWPIAQMRFARCTPTP